MLGSGVRLERGEMMGFWIYMLLMDLLIPLTMIGFGSFFVKHAPNEINGVFGYRTNMSMKNRDTWGFAHQYCGAIWLRWGMIMLPCTVIALLFVLGREDDVVGIVGGAISLIHLLPMVGSIVATERALRKNFDEHGIRKRT